MAKILFIGGIGSGQLEKPIEEKTYKRLVIILETV